MKVALFVNLVVILVVSISAIPSKGIDNGAEAKAATTLDFKYQNMLTAVTDIALIIKQSGEATRTVELLLQLKALVDLVFHSAVNCELQFNGNTYTTGTYFHAGNVESAANSTTRLDEELSKLGLGTIPKVLTGLREINLCLQTAVEVAADAHKYHPCTVQTQYPIQLSKNHLDASLTDAINAL